MNKKTKAVTFSGLAIALIVILMLLASFIDVLDYTASAICGIIVTFIIVEFSTRYALSVYFGASILSLLLLPTKITAILFVAFCGWYPFVKRYLERIKEPFSSLLKLLIFNAALTVIILISRSVFLFEVSSSKWYVLLYLLCNFTFIIYDVLITKLIWLYVHKYKKQFKIFK